VSIDFGFPKNPYAQFFHVATELNQQGMAIVISKGPLFPAKDFILRKKIKPGDPGFFNARKIRLISNLFCHG
jgi:hypothetical protein